ncbi:glycoside hydrolase family 78 protein [Sphaerobolus stellatus SS14]|uniref:Glycoside hydrolase family 78 protein n=1 Tax=Sphaerobolus stellatus (strain SS14) TaxID=990650 RepID=A0A0C9V5G3_SPHS4|nr:glycoside hydrolase family 78 protein [Sphaerobolus stellatus SS14]
MEMQGSDEGPAIAKNNPDNFEPFLLSPNSSSTKIEDPSADSSGVQPATSFDGAMLHPPAQPTRMISLQSAKFTLINYSISAIHLSRFQPSLCKDSIYISPHSFTITPPQLPLPPRPPLSSPPSPPPLPHPYSNERANTSQETLSPQRETQRYPYETDKEYFIRLDQIFKERVAAHHVYSQPMYHIRSGYSAHLSMPDLTENEVSQTTYNYSFVTEPPAVAREHKFTLHRRQNATTSSLRKIASAMNPLNILYKVQQWKSEKGEPDSTHTRSNSQEGASNESLVCWAYTDQTNTIPLHTGHQANSFVPSALGWLNNTTLGIAGPIIVDGAKCDRAVWPSDMGIAVPAQIVSMLDLIATKNALGTIFAATNSKIGAFPELGPPLPQLGSDTHHSHTHSSACTHTFFILATSTFSAPYGTTILSLLDTSTPVLTTRAYSTSVVQGTKLGLDKEDITSTQTRYTTGCVSRLFISLHLILNLHPATYNTLYVPSIGLFKGNNTDTTMYPEDGNSFAILYNLTMNDTQVQSISEGLTKNWNDLGPVTPELPGTITPFIAGFEVLFRYMLQDTRALDLMRRTWGFMLDTSSSMRSTLLEEFFANNSISYRSDHGYTFDAAYTSYSHGWSSGVTSALSFYVLGLEYEVNGGGLTLSGVSVEGIRRLRRWMWRVREMVRGLCYCRLGFGVGTLIMDGKALREVVRIVDGKGASQVLVGGGKHVVVARKG